MGVALCGALWHFVALCGTSEEEHVAVCSIRCESNTCALPKDKTERPVHSDTKDFVPSRAAQVLRRYVKLETGCSSTMINQFRFASSLWTRKLVTCNSDPTSTIWLILGLRIWIIQIVDVGRKTKETIKKVTWNTCATPRDPRCAAPQVP